MTTYYSATLYKDGKVIDAVTKLSREAIDHYMRTKPAGSHYTVKVETL